MDNGNDGGPNSHLEQLLLAALLADNQRFADIGNLKPEHFAWDIHRKLFETISYIIGQNLPATPKTLTYMLNGEAPYVAKLEPISSTPHAVAHWASELIALYYQRRIVDLANDVPRIFDQAKEAHSYLPRFNAVREEFERIYRERENDLPQTRLPSLDYSRLEDNPQITRQWLVEGWLPMGETCALGGTGGEGKTLLAHQLATVAALGCGDWLGMRVAPVEAALVLCEDNHDDAYWRQDRINRLYGCGMQDLVGRLLTLPLREAESNCLAVFDKDNNMELTQLFHHLLAELKAFQAKLVVLDTREDVFSGDQNNPIHARKFVRGCCDRIARELGGIVLLVYHPSIRGVSEGDLQSGSVQWNAAYRARLVMTRPDGDDDPDTRILSLIKSNLAPPTEALEIVWKGGTFVRKVVEDRPAYLGGAEKSKAARVFLELLDAYNVANRFVSTNTKAGNFAPKVFAQDPASEGCTAQHFNRAMLSLFDRKMLINKTYGIPSRPLFRVARASD